MRFKLFQMFQVFSKIRPSHFFLIAAILFEISYTCFRPPMQSPDEFNHFCRAYQISTGEFTPNKTHDRLGGFIPIAFWDFFVIYKDATCIPKVKIGKKEIIDGFKIKITEEKRFFDFPNTAYYSLVSYAPQAIAMYVINKFTKSVGALYYGGKIAAFILWLLAMCFVIKTVPVYKWLFVAFFLLPMNVYMVNSFSADIVTNILSFLMIALTLKHALNENKITTFNLLVILALCILLVFAKVVYAGLLIILLTIPSTKFKFKSYKYICLCFIFFVTLVTMAYWSQKTMSYYISYDNYNLETRNQSTLLKGSNYFEQKKLLLNDKTLFLKVVFNSITTEPKWYLRSYIGHFGTYMDTPVPDWFFISNFFVLILITLFERNLSEFSILKRVILILKSLIIYSMLVISLHLTWNLVGSESMDRVQGRYLTPIFPLLFMLFYNPFKKIKFNVGPIVMLFVLLNNLYVCSMLKERYIGGSASEKITNN